MSEIKNRAEIGYYAVIDSNGFAKVEDASYEDSKKYTISLSDTVVRKLNQMFNATKKLIGYKILTRLPENTYYAGGSYRYISVTFDNNKKESLCYIDALMSDSFNDFIEELESKNLNNNPVENNNGIITSQLAKAVTDLHKKCSYLPVSKDPPPMEEIKSNN